MIDVELALGRPDGAELAEVAAARVEALNRRTRGRAASGEVGDLDLAVVLVHADRAGEPELAVARAE